MSELKEILERYSILIEAMECLEQEVPIIEREYQGLRNLIREQAVTTEQAVLRVETKADSSIKQFQVYEAKLNAMMEKQTESLRLIETSMTALEDILRLADSKINVLTELVNSKTIGLPTADISNNKRMPSRKIYPSAKSEFASDAMRFTFDKQKTVRYKKPYGIVIEGEILKANDWSKLLEQVIYFSFDNYGADKYELVSGEYGIHLQRTEIDEDGDEITYEKIIPYFVEGNVYKEDGYQYRYLKMLDISALYNGADAVVNVIKSLLCEYLKIFPQNI